jgi:N-acylneuraminate cytidylyltransferase
MIGSARVLALITARGGSKGIPGKNVRLVGGKPLIAWSVEAALASRSVDRVVLSSDDDSIMETARRYGCDVPFKRDAALATDESSSLDVVMDALQRCPGYEWIVLLQPTSPLRTAADIDGAIDRCVTTGAPACVSICEALQSPYWMYMQREGRLMPVIAGPEIQRRQDLPPVYVLNGAVYVARTDWFLSHRLFVTEQTVGYEMPESRSVDIDDMADLVRVDSILSAP